MENAWEFTYRNPQAKIEVGTAEQDGKRVYFVRGDGADFDMIHINKFLFNVFIHILSSLKQA